MATVRENLLQAKAALDRGDMDYYDFVEVTDPTNKEGVWGDLVKYLEDLANSGTLSSSQRQSVQAELLEVMAQSPGQGSKVDNAYRQVGIEPAILSDHRSKLSAPETASQFVPILDFSENLLNPSWSVTLKDNLRPESLAQNDFVKVRMAGYQTGHERDVYVRMATDKDDPSRGSFWLPGAIGRVDVDKSAATVDPTSGALTPNSIRFVWNGQQGNASDFIAATNPETHNKIVNVRNKITDSYKRLLGKQELSPGEMQWINDRVNTNTEEDLFEVEAEIKNLPEYKNRESLNQALQAQRAGLPANSRPGFVERVGERVGKFFAPRPSLMEQAAADLKNKGGAGKVLQPFVQKAGQALQNVAPFITNPGGPKTEILERAMDFASKGFETFRAGFKRGFGK